ncbi:MAG: hypothetical protein UW92_C0037G0007 [Candidatus Jorgensenbacteria bacterium GW2011_GWA2_45_13]|uniref:Uncharacterized protein n=1 Tax=Candidatus Jorgensenbacteria bacterium GW2011_GWA2_45_13 TaxID=1618662 RepID=A0A0G1L3Y5_9BACT|nr:MAG: hypothetical protein UW92_C0037G0007 [Candidatus Jorgensenbacteria bacterium GW2011_GWA2_45_13]
MEKQKVVFIPGFMDVAVNYSDSFGRVDIWKEKADWRERINADVVVGYSLGANFALLNWEKNKNTKLVLVNPLLPKRTKTEWAKRWISFLSAEGIKVNEERSKVIAQLPIETKLASGILSEEIDNVLDIIPKEKLAVIRGVHDDFFCDAEVGEYLKKKGIILYEVDAGHTWNKSIAEEVDILVKKFLYP